MWHNEILQTHIVHPTLLCARIGVWQGQLICLRPFICNWMGNSYFAARVPNAGASCLSSAPRSVSVADLGIATLGSCSALLQSVCMPIFGGGAGIVCRDHLHFVSPWISPRRCAPRRFRRRGCYFVRAPDVRVPSRDSGLGKRLADEREGRLQRRRRRGDPLHLPVQPASFARPARHKLRPATLIMDTPNAVAISPALCPHRASGVLHPDSGP
jgi:hypothetical protein